MKPLGIDTYRRIVVLTGAGVSVASLSAGCSEPGSASPSAYASSTASTVAAPGTSARAWPELPRTQEAARALIASHTRRELMGLTDDALEPDAIADAIGARPAALISGDERVRRWIQDALERAGARDAYLLFGTLHDSGGQIDAFRRLVGPLGVSGLTILGLEQLRADGAWADVPAAAQRGDGPELAAWLERGELDALHTLARRHSSSDYAAWKFGYEASVLELLAGARATATPVRGCDMPAETRALLGAVGDAERLRLRELHCLYSLPRPSGPRRAALLWGQAHVRRDGLRRFLSPDDLVVALDVFGHRTGEWTAEAALAKRVAITDPLLVPLDTTGVEAALLYPGGDIAASVDRVRDELRPAEPGLSVSLRQGVGTLHIGERVFQVGAAPRHIELLAGDLTYVLSVSGQRFVGALALPPGSSMDLVVDASARAVSLTVHQPPWP